MMDTPLRNYIDNLLRMYESYRVTAERLRLERDEAVYHLKIFAHAYKTGNSPPKKSVKFAESFPVDTGGKP